jgi:pimeloyl-ACP methyl ester carboxylesterase
MEPITGIAAGVPFTALPPVGAGPAPLLVTWHQMDSPCTNAAFAAALPLHEVPAWRVHLGMPLCGARSLPDRDAAFVELVRRDIVLAYIDPVVRQAADEFPAALAELRERLPVDDGPIGVVGSSLGGAVALRVLARREIPIAAAAVVNAGIRARSVVGLVEGVAGEPYRWHDESQRIADRLDFVARAEDVAGPPVLVVSGELDFPDLRTDAAELAGALRERYAEPEHVRLVTIPGLAHPLAEPPGVEPAPQLPAAKAVDDVMTEWFLRHLRR